MKIGYEASAINRWRVRVAIHYSVIVVSVSEAGGKRRERTVRDGRQAVIARRSSWADKSRVVVGVTAGLLKELPKEAGAKRKRPTAKNANVAVLASI